MFFIRYGVAGTIGRFRSLWGRLQRDERVVCRTPRGLEIGAVLGPAEAASNPPHGEVLRTMSPEDELLLERLERHKQRALEDCARELASSGAAVTLLDAEVLFDGRTILFHLLGEAPPEVDAVVERMAATYEARIELQSFSRLLDEGCGPGCGTESAAGCGGGCATCAIGCGK